VDHSRKKKVTVVHLTEKRVTDAKPGEYADDEVKYLRLYVSESGAKTWGIYKWIERYAVRRSIGRAGKGEISVEDARAEAIRVYKNLKSGEPSTPKEISETSLQAVLDRYTARLTKEQRKQPKWAADIFKRKNGGVDYSDWG
jgi:hypothetical protein